MYKKIKNFTARFLDEKSGTTAIEYALIAVLIAVVIIVALQAVSTDVGDKFSAVGSAFQSGSEE